MCTLSSPKEITVIINDVAALHHFLPLRNCVASGAPEWNFFYCFLKGSFVTQLMKPVRIHCMLEHGTTSFQKGLAGH